MVSSDIHLAQGEAKDTVMESMAHVKLPTNSNKQYEHDEFIKVQNTVKRVLTETYNDLTNGKGMSELLEVAPNDVNSIKTTDSVSYKTVLKESADEAAKANKVAKAKDANAATIMPLIPDVEAARAEADRRNMYNQTVIGTKRGMALALRKIFGAHIIDKIIKTPDGSDNVSIDLYSLHDIMQCATDHATRPDIDDVRALLISFYDTQFDFRETVNQNVLKLKEEATKIKQFGLNIAEPELVLVIVANVNKAAKSGRWGTEFRTTTSKIKKLYPYNHKHDATSLADILAECAEADTARDVRDAPAPGGKALAANRSILLDTLGQSERSNSTDWSEYDRLYNDPEAYINSDGEAYETKRYKSERRRDGRSVSSSIASSAAGSNSDSSSAKTTATDMSPVDCKYCTQWKRKKAHPPKVPVEQCMWNPKMIGYRFENVCKAMGLKYRSPDKFPRNKKEVWKRHHKLEAKTDA